MTGIVPGPDFMKSLTDASLNYHASLSGSPGEAYLAKRGISPLAMDYFKLGYVSDPTPEHREFTGMVSIPYITRSGVVSLRFRRIEGSGPKYMSLHGTAGKARPFNVRAFQRVDSNLCICEGEFDTITASQCGLTTVGYPGANAWKSEHWRLYRYRHVYVLADNDDTGAGMGFANAIASDLRDCKIIQMPKGHDVNSYFLEVGEDEFRGFVGI